MLFVFFYIVVFSINLDILYSYMMQVEQYKQRVTRKKTSVEAMLKTAVQSQLDGVISGLQQLQSALLDINDIRQRLANN